MCSEFRDAVQKQALQPTECMPTSDPCTLTQLYTLGTIYNVGQNRSTRKKPTWVTRRTYKLHTDKHPRSGLNMGLSCCEAASVQAMPVCHLRSYVTLALWHLYCILTILCAPSQRQAHCHYPRKLGRPVNALSDSKLRPFLRLKLECAVYLKLQII